MIGMERREEKAKLKEMKAEPSSKYISFYLFLWSGADGILRILQSDWFRERAVFSYLLTTVMVTNYAERRVKLRIERASSSFRQVCWLLKATLHTV